MEGLRDVTCRERVRLLIDVPLPQADPSRCTPRDMQSSVLQERNRNKDRMRLDDLPGMSTRL